MSNKGHGIILKYIRKGTSPSLSLSSVYLSRASFMVDLYNPTGLTLEALSACSAGTVLK